MYLHLLEIDLFWYTKNEVVHLLSDLFLILLDGTILS